MDERLQYHSMDRLLRDIERFLELDAKEGKKNFHRAIFDGNLHHELASGPGSEGRGRLPLARRYRWWIHLRTRRPGVGDAKMHENLVHWLS